MNYIRFCMCLLLLCFHHTVGLAQPALTIEVSGVSGEQLDNVKLMLSIEQQK